MNASFLFSTRPTYLNLSLACIRGMVFQNFDCYNFISAFLPALDNLRYKKKYFKKPKQTQSKEKKRKELFWLLYLAKSASTKKF